MIPWLNLNSPFPNLDSALTLKDGAPGLLAAGADLSPNRLIDAYSKGIFPWFNNNQPILWWSTDPRFILNTQEFKISGSLKKSIKKIEKNILKENEWQIKFNSDFLSVITACAEPRKGVSGSWINSKIIEAYFELHKLGYAHSIELWFNKKLLSGVYGICIGRIFFGESMFTKINNGSKVTLSYLVHFLKSEGVKIIDCQQETNHLRNMGGKLITRKNFVSILKEAIELPAITTWKPKLIYNESFH